MALTTGTLSAINGSVTLHKKREENRVLLTVTGTFAGLDLTVEGSADGTNYSALGVVDRTLYTLAGNGQLTGLSTSKTLEANGAGLRYVRITASALSSGSAAVTISAMTGEAPRTPRTPATAPRQSGEQTNMGGATAIPATAADFTADPLDPYTTDEVTFTYTGGLSVATYLWDFGDGDTSTSASPTHTYDTADTYSPSLTVTLTTGGTASKTNTNYITATVWTPAALGTDLLWDSGDNPPVSSAIPGSVSVNGASYEVSGVFRGHDLAFWQLGSSGFGHMTYAGGIDSTTSGQIYSYTTGPVNVGPNSYIPRVSATVFSLTASGGSLAARVNGSAYSPAVDGLTGVVTGGTVGNKTGGGWTLNGAVSRMVITNPLSSANRSYMLQYLRSTYSITAYAGQVVGAGDSITAGYNQSQNFVLNGWSGGDYTYSYPYYFSQAMPAWKVLNHGVTAITIATMTTNDTTGVDPYYDASRFTNNVCVVFAGTNDLSVDDVSLATLQSRVSTYCAARKSAGWTVVYINMLDRGNFTAGQRVIWGQFISWVTGGGLAASVSAVVEPPTQLAGVSPWATYPSFWDSDHIHLSRTGYQVLGASVATTVSGL